MGNKIFIFLIIVLIALSFFVYTFNVQNECKNYEGGSFYDLGSVHGFLCEKNQSALEIKLNLTEKNKSSSVINFPSEFNSDKLVKDNIFILGGIGIVIVFLLVYLILEARLKS